PLPRPRRARRAPRHQLRPVQDRLPTARDRCTDGAALHPELLADARERHRHADDQLAGEEGPVDGGRDECRRKPERRRRRAARRPPLRRVVVRRRVPRPRGPIAPRRTRAHPLRPRQARVAAHPGGRRGLTMTATTNPVRLVGELEPRLSRWLWLVKWLLLIPHLIVLGFLWTAFVVLTIVAFVTQLRGGRY